MGAAYESLTQNIENCENSGQVFTVVCGFILYVCPGDHCLWYRNRGGLTTHGAPGQ
ncbi:unnamed protein product [Staurois parvus]|uniref:Uncharacterized protein n=1 Tax=Staurois parvus TaxID=386267 RepID=A0ABN9H2F6_9NEOB|nr:unnamed protein product [Staurois parvus]